jgi:hypothetical protein
MARLGTTARRALAPLRRVPLPLALLLGVAAVLSLSWSLATAPLQGPDEAEHAAFVEHLAHTGHFPSATEGQGAYAADEAGALAAGFGPMLQKRTARPPWSARAEAAFAAHERSLPDSALKTGDGPNSVGKNPPLYYVLGAVTWKLTPGGYFTQLFWLRVMGGVLLLAMVALSWLMAGEVFRRTLPRTVVTAVVALQPLTGFMSAVINTDILLATLWTAFLWLALRTARLGVSWQRCATLSLTAVLAVLTHGRGLAILPPLAGALVVAWLVRRRPLRDTAIVAAASAAVLGAGLLVYRVVTSAAGGGSLYGGEVTLGPSSNFSFRQLLSYIWQFYLPRLDQMTPRPGPDFGYRQFYVMEYLAGIFSSFEVYFPFWVYDLVQVVAGLLLLVLYTLAVVHFRVVRVNWPKVVIVLAAAVSLLLFLHVASYRALANGSNNPLLAGRYLLPFTPFLGLGIGCIVAGLPRRVGSAIAAVVLVGMLALSLGGIALSVERFYA